MIIVRPHDSAWRAIANATGDKSWDPEAMNKYFERVERCLYLPPGSGGGHGNNGWLPTRFADTFDLVGEAIRNHDAAIGRIALASALGAGLRKRDLLRKVSGRAAKKNPAPAAELDAHIDPSGIPRLLDAPDPFDPNDVRLLGEDIVPLRVPMAIDEDGRRAGTRERIRAAQRTGRLEVRPHCHVTGLLFDANDDQRVVGVRYRPGVRLYRADRNPARFGNSSGPDVEVFAEREVILSAGAFITPQLLMLSGIGPEHTLNSFGIRVRRHLPGVGANLQDRYEVGIVTKAREAFGILSEATFAGPVPAEATGDPLFEQWRGGKGLYATNGVVLGFIKKSTVAKRSNDEPDLFVFGVPGSFDGYYTDWSSDSVKPPHDKWTWLLLKAHARFRGEVTLRTKDPLDPPEVHFNYFERDATGALTPDAAADLEAMREGVRFVNSLIEATREDLTLHPQIMQGVDLDSDAGIDAFVENRAWGHHASCTCKIGGDDDEKAVRDSSFRVRGVKGLRVVDASVFPRIPGFFLVMPTYMISEKAADAIHADTSATE